MGYECEVCGGEPPAVSTYETRAGRVFCSWCLPEAVSGKGGACIRSVLVESRDYSDTYGNTYSSAALWINGGFVGVFGLRYGSPEVLEDYEVGPYLEAVGILPHTPAGQYSPHIRNRLKELGADYYLTQDHTTRRRCWKETNLEERASLWALLLRREKNRGAA